MDRFSTFLFPRAPYEFGDIQINARGKINVEEQELIYDDDETPETCDLV